jgi:hypothetical protein
MPKNKPQQKLVSFTDNQVELHKISEDIKNVWSIISLVKNGNYYVGIMELNSNFSEAKETVFIPPRKRIKISR